MPPSYSRETDFITPNMKDAEPIKLIKDLDVWDPPTPHKNNRNNHGTGHAYSKLTNDPLNGPKKQNPNEGGRKTVQALGVAKSQMR